MSKDSSLLKMAPQNDKLTLCTFNCRSVKSSLEEVVNLCDSCDLIFLQEHWLLPYELDYLSRIHSDYIAIGQSSVDISSSALVGRPYGGTGILYKQSLSGYIWVVNTDDPRITAVILNSKCGPILLVCVYMPTHYGDGDSFENYISTSAKITALFAECDAVELIVAGDFNCQHGSRFFDIFSNFVLDNDLMLTDFNRLHDVFTYCNDAGTSMSWIDHIVCSKTIDCMVSNCSVLYDFVSSDHKQLTVTFAGLCLDTPITAQNNNK